MNVSMSTPTSYSDGNWGVQFGNGGLSTAINCTASAPCYGLTIRTTNTLTRQSLTTTRFNATGSLSVTLDFSSANPKSVLPTDIQNLFSAATNGVTITPLYSDPNQGGTPSPLISTGTADTWLPDQGAIITAPSLTPIAMDGAFALSITPASASTAVQQSPLPSAGTPTALVYTTDNSITGYVIAYWKDSNCSASGWSFAANPVSYATTAPAYTCTYTPYNTSFGIGGTSPSLGCGAVGPFLTTPSGMPALTADTAAVPSANVLSTLVANPLTEVPSGCMNLVYIPTSSAQKSWTKTGITNGDIYGATAWTLNAASPTANYSLAHANVVYIKATPFVLASLEKNSSLSKTTDCFVVTAASGNVNSPSVFYWRILRDSYLTPMGITPFYYRHAQTWAAWLDKHPSLKPALNFVFEKSGYFFYHTGQWIKSASKTIKHALTAVSDMLDQKASAQELTNVQPRYDLFFTGGVLLPTQDKSLYDKYYASQPTAHYEIGASRIFWWQQVGLSFGGLMRYVANSQTDSTPVLGSYSQSYQRTFYSLSAEGLLGLRYRHPDFPYVVPGIFAGAGITRFREQAVATGASADGTTQGITQWSPVFEFGGALDIGLLNLIRTTNTSPTYWLNDVLLRLSASYDINPTQALSSTGIFVQGGFSFLIQ